MLRSTCNGPKATMEGTLMDAPSKEFALAGTLEELKIKGQLVVHVAIVRSSSSTTAGASSPSTIGARTWASRSSAAASKTAS
jgi:hypothetical protein